MLLDSSVWVDLLSRSPRVRLSEGERRLAVTCPPVIQEVLQGVREDLAHERLKMGLLALPRVGDPVDLDLHLEAAGLYRRARRKGLTVRSSVDCLIAAIALRHGLTVWHVDRDFEVIAAMTDLRTRPVG